MSSAEQRQKVTLDRDLPPPGACLGTADGLPCPRLPAHVDDAVVEVDCLSRQSAQLANAQPGVGGHRVEGPPLGTGTPSQPSSATSSLG